MCELLVGEERWGGELPDGFGDVAVIGDFDKAVVGTRENGRRSWRQQYRQVFQGPLL